MNGPEEGRPAQRPIRDRDVVLVAVVIVFAVLGANLASASIPPIDQLLAVAPVLVIVLVAGTVFVLIRALRRPQG